MDTPCTIQNERASRNVGLLHNWTADTGIVKDGGAKAIYFVLTSFKSVRILSSHFLLHLRHLLLLLGLRFVGLLQDRANQLLTF
jgi:hypothetical protein